jgi:hypothetical protein
MPGMLSGKLRPHASAQIQQEVSDKITGPLVAAFMEQAEKCNEGSLKRIASMRLVEPADAAKIAASPPTPDVQTSGILAVAQQHEQEQGNAP